MFRRQRYQVFHWVAPNNQIAGVVALMPDLNDAYDHAERLLLKYGLQPAGPENNWFRSLVPGIPNHEWVSAHSEKEIRLFLSAIGKSMAWDFKSTKAVEFDPGTLSSPFYSSTLNQIRRSLNRRCWLHDTLGIEI